MTISTGRVWERSALPEGLDWGSFSKEAVWPVTRTRTPSTPFEPTSKRRRGFPERGTRDARRSHHPRW